MHKWLFAILFCAQLCAYPIPQWKGIEYTDEQVSQLITVIISTNPIPSHPNTDKLYEAQKSLFLIPALRSAHKLIVFDGIQPGHEDQKAAYEEYKHRVQKLCEEDPYFANTDLVFCKEWKHLSGALGEAIQQVTTPFVLINQHDLELKKEFNLNGLIATMVANPEIGHVRLYGARRNIPGNASWDGPIDVASFRNSFVPLCRAFGWSDQTHIAPTSYYREFVLPLCQEKKTFMEGILQPAFQKTISIIGKEDAHALFGTYLYGGPSDGAYIWHSDGQAVWGTVPYIP